jgi:hypothetical protein
MEGRVGHALVRLSDTHSHNPEWQHHNVLSVAVLLLQVVLLVGWRWRRRLALAAAAPPVLEATRLLHPQPLLSVRRPPSSCGLGRKRRTRVIPSSMTKRWRMSPQQAQEQAQQETRNMAAPAQTSTCC